MLCHIEIRIKNKFQKVNVNSIPISSLTAM